MLSKRPILKCKYLYLLFALITYFVTMALLTDRGMEGEIHAFIFPLVILFSVYSISSHKISLIIALILALITFIQNWLFKFSHTNDMWAVANYIISLLFLGIITRSVIDNLLTHKEVTIDTLLGAISGYILFGFMWTLLYMIIAIFDPTSFSDTLESGDAHQRLLHFAYYSFASLTTLGYGDILAISGLARTLSWLEAILGQSYLTIWIAQLVGSHIARKHNSH